MSDGDKRAVEYEIKQMLNNDDFEIDDRSSTSFSQSASTLFAAATITADTTSELSTSKSGKKVKPTAMEAFLTSVGEDTVEREIITSRASIIEEFHNYRSIIGKNNARHKPSTSSCLDFWKTYQATFPLLAKIAIQVVCTPATSVPSECAFSMSAYVGRKERAKLLVESLAATVFLKVSFQREDVFGNVPQI